TASEGERTGKARSQEEGRMELGRQRLVAAHENDPRPLAAASRPIADIQPRAETVRDEHDDPAEAELQRRRPELQRREEGVKRECERPNAVGRVTKKDKEKPKRTPIRLLGEQEQLDVAKLLRGIKFTQGDAEMSLAQLLDANAHFRSQLAWYCQSTNPRKRPKKGVEAYTLESMTLDSECFADAEPGQRVGEIKNFYTKGAVKREDGTL